MINLGRTRRHAGKAAAVERAAEALAYRKRALVFTSADAHFSPCGRYRYSLSREWGGMFSTRRRALFLMLNPSKANAERLDPTVTRCVAFADAFDCTALDVGNLCGIVATDPREMLAADDPIGPDNDTAIAEMAARASVIVCAWGARARHPKLRERPARILATVRGIIDPTTPIVALRLLADGTPEHPLYVPSDVMPVSFDDTYRAGQASREGLMAYRLFACGHAPTGRALCPICGSTDLVEHCTCGSGAHPRPCDLHPNAYAEHVAELNEGASEEGDDEEARRG